MARTSFRTYLMYKPTDAASAYEKLIDIKEFPDLGKAPDTIDITTLTDGMKTYLQDIADPGQLEFTANYDLNDFKKLKALEHKPTKYAVWFGATTAGGTDTPSGSEGKFEFTGELAVTVKGAGVSSAVDMSVAIAPSTPIKQVD